MPRNPYLRQRVMSTRSDEKFGKKAWDGASLLHQCWASYIFLRWEVAMNHRTNRTQNRFLVNITLFTVATSFWDIFALQPTWHNHVQAKSSHAWLLCVLRESLRDAAPAAGSDIQQDGDCRQAPRQSEKAWWNQPLHTVHCLRISQVFSFSSTVKLAGGLTLTFQTFVLQQKFSGYIVDFDGSGLGCHCGQHRLRSGVCTLPYLEGCISYSWVGVCASIYSFSTEFFFM